jgi:hypothetical protein
MALFCTAPKAGGVGEFRTALYKFGAGELGHIFQRRNRFRRNNSMRLTPPCLRFAALNGVKLKPLRDFCLG